MTNTGLALKELTNPEASVGVVRVNRKPYIPVVLSREEIDEILKGFNSGCTTIS